MRLEFDRNFIFLGSNRGVINFYDLIEDKDHTDMLLEKQLEILVDSDFRTSITDIKYKNGKKELITGLSNGSIAFWSHDPFTPEYILESHQKSISRIFFDETNKMLITCSADKTIKVINQFIGNRYSNCLYTGLQK
jgi:WD40 repeat protein